MSSYKGIMLLHIFRYLSVFYLKSNIEFLKKRFKKNKILFNTRNIVKIISTPITSKFTVQYDHLLTQRCCRRGYNDKWLIFAGKNIKTVQL